MPWPDLLEGFRDAVRSELPDFVVEVGTWAAPPRVDSVYIAKKMERWGDYHERSFDIYVGLWVEMLPEDSHLDGYKRLAAHQQLVETIADAYFVTQPGVTHLKMVSWEHDDGRYVPVFAAGLDATVTQQLPCPANSL